MHFPVVSDLQDRGSLIPGPVRLSVCWLLPCPASGSHWEPFNAAEQILLHGSAPGDHLTSTLFLPTLFFQSCSIDVH